MFCDHSIETGVPKVCSNMFKYSTPEGSKGTLFSFLGLFHFFREKSNSGQPFVSFKRLLAFSFLWGQGKVTVKVKGKGKRRGNPSFCREKMTTK